MEGTYHHSIDAKGRLFIPVRLREELGDVFYVTRSIDKCLSAYSSENWQQFRDKVKELPRSQQNLFRPIFANAARCDIDGQGRVLLNQKLRDTVDLKKNVTIVGNNGTAEIWDSDLYASIEAVEMTQENIAKVFDVVGI